MSIPLLAAAPRTIEAADGEKLIVLRFSDYAALVRELKAACLALGGTLAECQAD